LHVLPHLPPEMLESVGTAEPAKDTEHVESKRADFIAEAEKVAKPMVDRAKKLLSEGGIPQRVIETQYYPSVATVDIVDDLLEVARREGFGTIVVGRNSWSRFKELFRHHICCELIKKADGVTVWVVE